MDAIWWVFGIAAVAVVLIVVYKSGAEEASVHKSSGRQDSGPPLQDYDRVSRIVDALIRDAKPGSANGLRWSSDLLPEEIGDAVEEGVRLKRSGAYLASVEAYDRAARSTGVLYTRIAQPLYKSVAASGALGAARRLMQAADSFWVTDPQSQETAKMFGVDQSWGADYLAELGAALGSPEALHHYLASISGNHNYRLPRDYASAKADFGDRQIA